MVHRKKNGIEHLNTYQFPHLMLKQACVQEILKIYSFIFDKISRSWVNAIYEFHNCAIDGIKV